MGAGRKTTTLERYHMIGYIKTIRNATNEQYLFCTILGSWHYSFHHKKDKGVHLDCRFLAGILENTKGSCEAQIARGYINTIRIYQRRRTSVKMAESRDNLSFTMPSLLWGSLTRSGHDWGGFVKEREVDWRLICVDSPPHPCYITLTHLCNFTQTFKRISSLR